MIEVIDDIITRIADMSYGINWLSKSLKDLVNITVAMNDRIKKLEELVLAQSKVIDALVRDK
jgi:hypothetical protein